MMRIFPYDILFFRESRDFSAGENHVAESIEPLPHTIAGAIMGVIYERGHLTLLNLTRENGKVKKIPDSEKWKPNFSILGTFFGLRKKELGEQGEVKPLFALPMDIVDVDGKPAILAEHPLLNGRKTVVAKVGNKRTLHFKPRRGFLTAEILEEYLSGAFTENTISEEVIIDVGSVYQRETRIGIGLNENRTAEKGLLYRISTLRFSEEAEILVYFESGDEEVIKKITGQGGLLKLGGESRFANFSFDERAFPLKAGGDVKADEWFRLYVATPLIVKDNSVRTFIEKELGGKARVVNVFTDRPLRVTGWDAVEGMPKPTYYALPPGTVIWLEAKENLSVPAKLGRMKWAGYGLVFVGGGW